MEVHSLCLFSEPHEPVQHELTALDQELEQQTVQLREWQMQELLKLRQQLHALEREKQHTQLPEVGLPFPKNGRSSPVHLKTCTGGCFVLRCGDARVGLISPGQGLQMDISSELNLVEASHCFLKISVFLYMFPDVNILDKLKLNST